MWLDSNPGPLESEATVVNRAADCATTTDPSIAIV